MTKCSGQTSPVETPISIQICSHTVGVGVNSSIFSPHTVLSIKARKKLVVIEYTFSMCLRVVNQDFQSFIFVLGLLLLHFIHQFVACFVRKLLSSGALSALSFYFRVILIYQILESLSKTISCPTYHEDNSIDNSTRSSLIRYVYVALLKNFLPFPRYKCIHQG